MIFWGLFQSGPFCDHQHVGAWVSLSSCWVNLCCLHIIPLLSGLLKILHRSFRGFGSPLGLPMWLLSPRLPSELSHLIKDVALEPAVSGKPAFPTENELCKLSFGRNFPLVKSLAQPGGFLEQGQQVQRSELYLQCCCILSLSLITCRTWVWDHSAVFSLIIHNTLLEVPRTVWFKAENYKLKPPTLLWFESNYQWEGPLICSMCKAFPGKKCWRRGSWKLRQDVRVSQTEAKVEENGELAKKMSSVTLVITAFLEWGRWKSAWRGSKMLDTGNIPAMLILP